MVKVRYVGIREPAQDFEALRPAYRAVIAMMIKCKPFSPDYVALLNIADAMNGAAKHFMPDRPEVSSFFGSKPTG